MYHYYLRYSVYQGTEKIADSWGGFETEEAITNVSQISEIANTIKNDIKSDIPVTHVIIDFYQFLSKDPD